MMLIIAMLSFLYPVCLVCGVLKNTYFKEHPLVIGSKYSLCNTESNTWEFKLCSMFKLSPNGKGIIFGPNVPPWFIAPMEKVWFYERFFFEVVMVKVRDKRKYNKKMQCK